MTWRHDDYRHLQAFVHDTTTPEAEVYSDGAAVCHKLDRDHEPVNDGVEEYARGEAHVNGMESNWAPLKRVYHGTHQSMSERYPPLYIQEHNGRSEIRPLDVDGRIRLMVAGSVTKKEKP